ncbi:isoaspartyl peptidase/L-asparaginase [bacterium]|nr:isoaspartyl peptidase/L-asparaginase [bacterium]
MNQRYSIAIHGGAGTIRQGEMTPEKQNEIEKTLNRSIKAGINILKAGGSAIDATASAVVVMEDSPLFNAGKGCVFNSAGFIEMDASIMCGKTLDAGAVTCVRNVRNPILLSQELLTGSRHVLLSGKGAEDFARKAGLAFEADDYFFTRHRYEQLQKAKTEETVQLDHSGSNDGKFGTVGAVALDLAGNLAAATSTGGMTNQAEGRVGDTPIIGSGNYANNQTCAVSCTGIGEGFMRSVTAFDVSALIEYKGLSLTEACEYVIHEKLPKVRGMGGLIAVDIRGNIAVPFNSEGMYRAWCQQNGEVHIGMYRE